MAATSTRKSPAKKAATRKAPTRKAAPKKAAPKGAAPKKDAPRKAAPKGAAPKKDAPRKAAPRTAARNDNQTVPTGASVEAYLASVEPARREDARALAAFFSRVTGEKPRLWGASMVGFGSYHYRYPTGREGDTLLTGFSPRKSALTLYLMAGLEQEHALLARLGPHSIGKGCLYLKRLSDVDLGVLEKLVRQCMATLTKRFPPS